jgi:hypothetical protein
VWHRAKDAAVAGQVQKGPRSGTQLGTRAATALGEDRNRRKPVLFEVPSIIFCDLEF